MEWIVLDWNEPSRKFYFSIGVKAMDDWTTFRMTRKELKKLVES